MSVRSFVHLHTHSHYSLLEALPKVSELVEAAKDDGQSAIALTDNGNMYGAVEFYKECVKAGIKPIIGVDFFVAPRTRFDKEHNTDEAAGRLVLLAKNMHGYKNLIKLVSLSYLEGMFNGRPRIDRELIERHREGLVAIIPSYGGEVAYALRHNDAARAAEALSWHGRVFGGDCFIEITMHPEIAGHEAEMAALAEFAKERGVPLVAAQDIYYMKRDDALACDLVNKIRTGGVLNREGEEYVLKDFSFRSSGKMHELFKHLPEALENSLAIAKRCDLELTLGKAIFPVFPIPAGTTDDAELRALAETGIGARGLEDAPALRTRIDYELDIIKTKGYASYFLIVADLLRHAREVGIFTNTRGSAAGSLVSYLCGITTVDPVKFNMPFERFLNPERPSAPDIDMDIDAFRRDELIDYARKKYGDEKVVQIGTFGTMMARAAVRDVARALGHPYALGDQVAKLIPFGKQGFPVTIKGALEEAPELAQLYKTDGDAREILDLAQKIEGNARHVGVHAAGVILAPEDVTEYTPIQPDPKGGKTITQYDMYSIADEYGGVGLLKFDFLGLTNLSVLADSVARVRERLGTAVDLDRIPLDDKKVYEMLTRGETLGVFQMAGGGMTAYLKELRPTVIHDLNAMVALYRPGPMAFIPDYIERKRNPARVTYLDPRMESILKPTYGVLIYQDDVMMMAVQLAGYSWGEADKFRKAMGKKIPEEMAKQKDHFTKGCIERGMRPAAAQKLWEQIETFAAYGFNKAHAASYGNLAYKTAYMKANFPVDYMAALLTAEAGDVEKVAETVAECKRMGITVLPPSVNESKGTFTVVDDTTIRFGLYSIKNFGTGVADAIFAAQPFADISDFIARIREHSKPRKTPAEARRGEGGEEDVRGRTATETQGPRNDADAGVLRGLNKKSLESLIMSGALDSLGERGTLLSNIETLLAYHREHLKTPSDQSSLFGSTSAPQAATIRLQPAPDTPIETKLAWEKELLGLYISGHPLDKHRAKLSNPKASIKVAKANPHGLECVIGGFLETSQSILTKNGERMAFFKIADLTDSIEVVAFPRTLKEHAALLVAGNCVMLKGKISDRNGEASFVVDKAKAL
jgi:DNA polymerase-3 subunit alpha